MAPTAGFAPGVGGVALAPAAGGAAGGAPFPLAFPSPLPAATSAFLLASTAAKPPGAPIPGITATGAAEGSGTMLVGRSTRGVGVDAGFAADTAGFAPGMGAIAGFGAVVAATKAARDGAEPFVLALPAAVGAAGGGRFAAGGGARATGFGLGGTNSR